ncbi:hypothetical protein LOTGIDRAFT_170844 [Lottia gigantea]|uniref:WSC domain-containing protein n=1 Tax=Lottia gigantea TaxID=225164 RepID=V4AJK8_LOTGI|nr:hypothetical protein LOTGIDRAFT_170844 [Lottia gigantea]ESP04344.1 hypothetical protein LOTGIDRAFT_170844 [Lottia gigantea]
MRLLQYIWMIGMIIGTVLSSSHEGYLYIGCYGNVFTGCKSNGIIQDINVEKCDKQCTGYVYIAIYNGKSCYCCNDDNFSISNKITASNCNKACPGDLQSLCGGTGAYKSYTSLYSRRNDKTISLETINIYTTTTQIMEISTKIETQTTTILPSPITTTHIVPCPSSANVETLTKTQMMEISTKIETQTTTILPSPITTTHIVPCPSPTQLQLCPTPAISVSSMVFSLNATKPIVSTKNVDGLTVQKSKACFIFKIT